MLKKDRLSWILLIHISLIFLLSNSSMSSLPKESFEPEADTVLLWHLDGDLSDASGNNVDGTKVGGEWVDGNFGQALMWTKGSSGRAYVDHSESFNIEDAITIETWAYLQGPALGPGISQVLIIKNQSFYLKLNDDKFEGAVYVDGWWRTVDCPAVFDEWVYVAMTYDSFTHELKLYIVSAPTDNGPAHR